MKEKISKFFNVMKRDGLSKTVGKTYKYVMGNYINKINIGKRISFINNKNKISEQIDEILASDYDRILVWRGSFGWNVPLFQRPQQIANCLTSRRSLILYEVTRMTDKVDFIKKENDNLYLVNYEIGAFEAMLFEKLKEVKKPKYLQLYSTCWDVKKEEVDMYVNAGFGMLYEYIDDLNPSLAGTESLPKNVADIHEYISNNTNVLVVTSADRLYEDMKNKRGTDKNLILSTNGVDLKHFRDIEGETVPVLEGIKKEYKQIIGYYGALATWFDYDLVKKTAAAFPDTAFVLIGIKYDTSYDEAKIDDIPNVKYLGAVDYKKLPAYANYFDICWIPFVINEITLATNPIKVFEYMAMNKYIITTKMPECMKYKSVKVADDIDEVIALINAKDENMTDEYMTHLNREADENSWEHKADEIIALLKTNE